MDLVLYGAYNLSLPRCFISQAPGEKDVAIDIQRINNANYSGSTIVGKKLNEKSISLLGVLTGNPLIPMLQELKKYLDIDDRYLRFSREWRNIISISSVDDWALTDDATNKALNTESYMYGAGSLQFDVVVSNSATNQATFTITNNGGLDLVELGKSGRGNIEFWLYIPDKKYITSVVVYVGSDASNYGRIELTKQYDGREFDSGWNYLSANIEDMSITGVVDYYQFGKYLKLNLAYDVSQTDMMGCLFGGMIWQNDDLSYNFKGYVRNFKTPNIAWNITKTTFQLDFLCYSGVAQGTNDISVYSQTGKTDTSFIQSINLDGSGEPFPEINIKLNTVTNIASIGISNQTTGDGIVLTQTWAVGDTIKVDLENKIVTKKNVQIAYANVLPRFRLGLNDLQIYCISTSENTATQSTVNSNLVGTV